MMPTGAPHGNKGDRPPPPVAIRWWARSWWVIGNGPSHLLFRAEERRVTHLTNGIARPLQEVLKGYQVIKDGKLVPLVRALIRINTADEFNRGKEEAERYKEASRVVLKEIQRLIYLPEQKIFEGQLARFATLLRAARRFQMEQVERYGPQFPISLDEERSKFWISDRHGNELFVSDCDDGPQPLRGFRCDPHSPIAHCAQELWSREQVRLGDRATSLYYVPTRKELGHYFALDEPAVSKLCRAEGFAWLPKAPRGRKK